ncbi:TrlF family AAA-like ATPase [Pseudomonas aeruginosa]|uniref:TrlF family AAA-like ATPase n=1 Tax=Pseudomonas aeruginosa TaxID=287 RepID=UPI0039BDDB58
MRGSVWGKWDIHLHSPLTNLNNQFKASTIDDYARKIAESELSLVGVTNYFFFKENELELVRNALRQLDCKTEVLGNLEFRISQPNKEGEWINIHVIFSEHVTTREINALLSKFVITNTTDSGKSIWCSEESFREHDVKISEVVVDTKSLLNHLEGSLRLGQDFLVAICPCGYGGFQPERNEGRSVAIAKEIDKVGQIVLGRDRDRNFFLREERYDGATAKPVFVCSDAHNIESVGTKYTWVKASPSFQGLKQTVFEPSDRVQQTDNFTEKTFVKPYFSRISVSGKIFKGEELRFQEQSIPLNPNLVAIIGGRGTGKSVFLDSMLSRLTNQASTERVRQISVENLSITLNQGGAFGKEIEFDDLTSDAYSYLHVSQGDIHNFSKNPNSLSHEIKRMLGIREEEFDSVTTQELSENLGAYRDFIDFWLTTDQNGQPINTPEYQKTIIDRNTQLISTLTSDQNKSLIARYQENTSQINSKANFITTSNELKALIERTLKQINERISDYNSLADANIKIIQIDAGNALLGLAENIESANQASERLKSSNDEIKAEFAKQGINQDISSLLSKVNEYQYSIDQAKQKLTEINDRTERYHTLIKKRAELSATYDIYVEQNRMSIDSAFGALQQTNPEWSEEQNKIVQDILKSINISGEILFDDERFYSGLEQCINKGKFRSSAEKTTRQKLEETFNVSDRHSLFKLLTGQKIILLNGEPSSIEDFFWKDEYFNQGGRYELMNYLFSPRSIKNYLYVNAEFTYKGRPVNKLSVGQRGTFYVCLKLATDPFGSPFVFDQPEDDLDNEFIVSELVPLFKSIKKYRQVIIVTHNANLVVNSDAEQILVANNDGELISYSCGALEDGDVKNGDGIKAMVCRILEGGHTAFENREKKYGII